MYSHIAFQTTFCRLPQPRQGRNIRQCVITREHLPRSLLWRVVRVRKADGSKVVTFDKGEGRSVYVSKSLESVNESIRKKRLAKALKCHVPHDVQKEIIERATIWDGLSTKEKGLMYCEIYGEEGVSPAVEEVQLATIETCEDLLYD